MSASGTDPKNDTGRRALPPRPWRTDPSWGVVDANGEPIGLYRADICRTVVEVFNAEYRRTGGQG
jgi:hypothetical protein